MSDRFVSSLSSHNLHLLFWCVLSIFALIWLFHVALFCAAIRIDSVSKFKFSFPYPYPSLFIWDFAQLSFEISIELFLFAFLFSICYSVVHCAVCAVSGRFDKPSIFFMKHSSLCIDKYTLYSMLANPLSPSILDTYSQSMWSFGYKTLCIVISFLLLWFICLGFSRVHFKNSPEYLTRGTAQLFIPLMQFLLQNS